MSQDQRSQDPQSFTYLCVSYPNYIIKRKKLSDACKKANNQDVVLQTKLINYIRMHPDHELRRQTQARDVTTNPHHREMHNSKINDLLISAEKVYTERIAYKQIWKAETEERRLRNLAKKQAEMTAGLINKAKKIQALREANIAMVVKQKEEGETIRLARLSKKKQ